MDDKQARALEAAAVLYTAIPGYLFQNESPRTISTLIIQLADALDDIEYERSGVPLLDILTGSTPGRRKRAILHLQHTHNLTEREGHILRYLANDRRWIGTFPACRCSGWYRGCRAFPDNAR